MEFCGLHLTDRVIKYGRNPFIGSSLIETDIETERQYFMDTPRYCTNANFLKDLNFSVILYKYRDFQDFK